MILQKLKTTVGLAVASIVSLGIALTSTAPAFADNVVHIRTTPHYERVSLDLNQTYKGSFTATNVGEKNFDFEVTISPYQVVGEKEVPTFNTENGYTQITKWITIDEADKKGTLAPNEEVEINYTITVPSDAPSGGQYAALLFTASGGQDSIVNTNGQMAFPIFAEVAGETHLKADISNVKINGFLFNPPISASSIVENKSNTHIDVEYILKVYPFFSGDEIYSNEENPQKGLIMPDVRRFATTTWDQAPKIGIYKVEYQVKIPALNKTETVTKLIVICPIWVWVLILIFVVAIIFWIISNHKAAKAGKKAEARLREKSRS